MAKISLMFNEVNCSGCHACEIACKQEHELGVGPRLVKVIERTPFFLPLYCHHCEDAPCAIACWEDAISIDQETGIVLHNNEKCNGCLSVLGVSGTEKQDTSPCMVGCPAHNNVQGFVSLAAKGEFRRAIHILKETSPFPSICGRVCPHPCEAVCNREQIDEAVAIRSVERFVADLDLSSQDPYIPMVKQGREEKVAIIGSGPAGLTAAYFLIQEGYQVTVFEKLPVPGGMMAVGIPEYRLPKRVLSKEIQAIRDLGVEIRTGIEFGTDITFQDLKREGYQAIFLATGLQSNLPLDIENENAEGVLRGIDFLRAVALGDSVSIGKKVIVVGGGNVAMDVAMTAHRVGAEKVSLVCLECREDMPAWESEIRMAVEEGAEIINKYGPNRFQLHDGVFAGIEFKRCTSVFDEQGRFNPLYDDTDLITIEADTAIVAIGQIADLSFVRKLGIDTSNGVLSACPLTMETPMDGVFAGGDAVYGPASIAQAIGSGREAAKSIDRYLNGRDLRLGRLGRDKALKSIKEPQLKIFDPSSRAEMPQLGPKVRIHSFDEVQTGFSEALTVQESNRCIMCGASCVQACPYDVMQFNHEIYKAVKCDLCIERRDVGVSPACATVCPTKCIYWGDPEVFPNGSRKVL